MIAITESWLNCLRYDFVGERCLMVIDFLIMISNYLEVECNMIENLNILILLIKVQNSCFNIGVIYFSFVQSE